MLWYTKFDVFVFNIIIPSYNLKKGHIRLIKLRTLFYQIRNIFASKSHWGGTFPPPWIRQGVGRYHRPPPMSALDRISLLLLSFDSINSSLDLLLSLLSGSFTFFLFLVGLLFFSFSQPGIGNNTGCKRLFLKVSIFRHLTYLKIYFQAQSSSPSWTRRTGIKHNFQS